MKADDLHRTMKLALDTGEAYTIEHAMAIFAAYQLVIMVGTEVTISPTLQAALLTAVNTGSRCFPGGVLIIGPLDAPVRLNGYAAASLYEAVVTLHGTPIEGWQSEFANLPHLLIGTVPLPDIPAPVLQLTFDGWAGGIIPASSGQRLAEQHEFPLAGVLAAALGVAESFQFLRGSHAYAGRRSVGLSLWHPEPTIDWQSADAVGPTLTMLPTRAWLIGLGHLGQAYIWAMGMLPYTHPEHVELFLQDDDRLTVANESTSLLLTNHLALGQKKTRWVARWCEQRGFHTTLIERPFRGDDHVGSRDPGVTLCGVDNPQARAKLEEVGFTRVIEAGLGQGPHEYLAFQVHTFPASYSAHERWGSAVAPVQQTELLTQPAYQALADAGVDQCGLTLLAGRTVAASFVGATVATLVVAEWIRMSMGEAPYELIDGTLQNLKHRHAIAGKVLPLYHPGLTSCRLNDDEG